MSGAGTEAWAGVACTCVVDEPSYLQSLVTSNNYASHVSPVVDEPCHVPPHGGVGHGAALDVVQHEAFGDLGAHLADLEGEVVGVV